jgi:TPR repeat protein
MKMFRHLAVVAVLGLSAVDVSAQDFDTGSEALDKGDFATAFREFKPLAEQGYAKAQFNLGYMYITGNGTTKDVLAAEKWFILSAESGDPIVQPLASVALWNLYYLENSAKNYDKAAYWAKKAAAQGDADSQFLIGYMYLTAEGVQKDNLKAFMWLSIALINGSGKEASGKAMVLLQIPESEMSPLEINLARKLTQQCMSSGYKNCGE